ncbi:MAG: non-ribosomal peptide synthetase, partial [Candidatus Methylomirabilales bacterium]
RLGVHFQNLLRGMVEDPGQRLGELPLLSEAEREQLLVGWNATRVDYPLDSCLHNLFEAQVERSPEAVAVGFENEQLTYQELNRRANQLAHHLRQRGVGPEVLVGVFMERSLEMVIGLYGILKAGGAYVPIDPEYPAERIAFMVEDSQAPVLLTQHRLVERLPAHRAQLLCLDTDWPVMAGAPGGNFNSGVRAGHLAYVIYTSGSTGRPKGAMNIHRGICNRLLWMQDAYQLTSVDRVLQKTPFSFDVSVWEFFWPLLTGARLVVARPEGHKDSPYLAELIIQQGITTLHFVPSMLQIFLQEPRLEACWWSLQRVICSGEALPYDLQERFFKRLSAQLHNLYGPTEAAIDVTFWECQPQGNQGIVPIGRPVANTQMYVLDAHLQPVPVGVAGELHIGGVQVGRGYLNRPELTAEKFLEDPFSNEPNARLYKTGDLARYLPDGSIEYLGRRDHQVKVRGFRIELGEIEAVLGGHPGVEEVVVLVREDSPGERRLVAYYVGAGVEPEALRGYLRAKLPPYMVPAVFMGLEA